MLTIFDLSASQRVPGEPEISLVSRTGDLRSRDFRPTESSEGDVRGEGDEEQDYQLRAGVRRVRSGDFYFWSKYSEWEWQYHARWTLMTTLWTTTYVSFKSEAVSYPIISISNFLSEFCRLWHHRDGDLLFKVPLQLRETKKSSAFHWNRGATAAVRHCGPSLRCVQILSFLFSHLSTFIQVITPLVGFKWD